LGEEKTYSESSKRSDVATLSSSSLNNEDSVPRGRGTLLDGVAGVDESVEGGVRSKGELGQRDVVRDGGREMHHRDVE
jgi:hypothetical protein